MNLPSHSDGTQQSTRPASHIQAEMPGSCLNRIPNLSLAITSLGNHPIRRDTHIQSMFMLLSL